MPAPTYQQGDRVLHSRIPELSSAKLKATLCPFFSDQILYIDEDVRCAAQLNGSLTLQDDHIFYALISEGVSGAIFYHGQVLNSAYSCAGEIGRMYTKSGKMIEEAVGIGGLCRLFTKPDGSVPSFQEVVANHREDPRLSAYLEQAIPELALLFANVTWLLDPKTIIVETPYSKLDPQLSINCGRHLKRCFCRSAGILCRSFCQTRRSSAQHATRARGWRSSSGIFTIWSDKDNLEDWLKGKGCANAFLWRRIRTNHRARMKYETGEHSSPLRRGLRQPRDGIHQENGRTQFAPNATQKKISTTQRTFLQRKRKFPACTVVHAGNPVIHRNPSITPFQGRVSGMGGRHPDKPPASLPLGLLPGGSSYANPAHIPACRQSRNMERPFPKTLFAATAPFKHA